MPLALGLTPDMLVVFGIILSAFVLFIVEPFPVDVTAIGIMVALMVLEPWTRISPREGIAGFANPATITVLAMMLLAEGLRRTGLVNRLGSYLSEYTHGDDRRQLGAVIATTTPISGFINNTAVVAMFLPMVTSLAQSENTSPSKLLLPLSYASMFGGMLTLIGTSTNILASDVSERIGVGAFGMFEFTKLGVVVLVVGVTYMMTVGYRLTPERIKPEEKPDSGDKFVSEITVIEGSPFVGMTVREALDTVNLDFEVLRVHRDERKTTEADSIEAMTIRPDDVFVVRATQETLASLLDIEGVSLEPEEEEVEEGKTLVEIVVTSGAFLEGETVRTAEFEERYNSTVLAVRKGAEVIQKRLKDIRLRPGDLLLIETTPDAVKSLNDDPDILVVGEVENHSFRTSKTKAAVGIVVGVVGLAAFDVLPILVSSLAGVLAMLVTGCIRPSELYDSVRWDVVFLLAGVIPLGTALEKTGAANLLGELIVRSADFLPAVGVLALFYVITSLLTNVVSNNASVVLMIPVAVEAASRLGANEFSFVLAVTFAASTAFISPIGYQTNLFVYGPGGYRFSDYLRVGGPLQILLAIATTAGIAFFWGV
ncbi:SLC13 family permease [Halorutilales archaeon Cl-col2-1]